MNDPFDRSPELDWELRPETILIEDGRPAREAGAPMNLPIVVASNFHSEKGGKLSQGGGSRNAHGPRRYARTDGTESSSAFADVVGRLEGGAGVAFSSGMAAVSAVMELLPAGATVLLPRDVYMGPRHLLEEGHRLGRWNAQRVELGDPDSVAACLPGAALLWIETPSNPLMEVYDLRALAAAAHEAGVLVAVDNTFATPLRQKPLELGADIVVHSATKFMGGHSDLLMGVTVTADPEVHEALVERRALAGATPGALECFLALRGLRTMAVRLAAAEASARELAHRLEQHPTVKRVYYPGLTGDPGHALAKQQMSGFGGVISFELDDADMADATCDAVRIIAYATSLGGVESTIERRGKHAGQEHVPPGLLRLSVGCEHVEDLWEDLVRAIPVKPPAD